MKTPLLLLICLIGLFSTGNAMQFQEVHSLSSISSSSSATGEKPQSKVWSHGGKHWAVIGSNSGTRLFRLDGTNWTNMLTLTYDSAKADCKVVGDKVYVLLHYGETAEIATLSYSQNSYSLSSLSDELFLDDDTETATLDIDGADRMWIAFNGDNDDDDVDAHDGPETDNIYVRWSDAPYDQPNAWSERQRIETDVDGDDLSLVVALPGKIAVLWSNQNTGNFGFRFHNDGASPDSWSTDEVPVFSGDNNFSDDHVNAAVAGDGTLYAGIKTSFDQSNEAAIALMVRRPYGTWDQLYEVANKGTRPIVVLNEALGLIRVIYTSQNGGGDILYKESSTSNISFGSSRTLMGGNYDNATSMKSTFSSETVILASDDSRVAGVVAIDDYTPALVSAPDLLVPEHEAEVSGTSVEFSWEGNGSDSYDVQVAEQEDFSSLIIDDNLSGTTLSLTDFNEGTEYFWRVRAIRNGEESGWSETRSFTMLPALAGVPVLEYPEDGAADIPLDPTLTWSPEEGAGHYEIEVARDAGFSDLLVSDSLTEPSFYLQGLANTTEYHWRVRSVNQAGESAWAEASFTTLVLVVAAPVLEYPQNGAENVPLDLSLSWGAAEGASAYELQVSTDAGFQSTLMGQTDISTTTYALEGLNPSTEYFWRVRAWNEEEVSSWAQGHFSTRTAEMPEAPVLVSPEPGATNVPLEVSLSWNSVEGAGGYELQVSTDAGFADSFIAQQNVVQTSFSLDSLRHATEYFWRVRANMTESQTSWSQSSFTTVEGTAEVPVLEQPENLATDVPREVELSWKAVEGTETYGVQVSKDSSFNQLVTEAESSESTYSLGNLEASTGYFWRVRAEISGTAGEWSEVWKFTTTAASDEPDLVGHWKMENVSGGLLKDESSFGNDASISGNPVVISGVDGEGVSFQGSGQFAVASDHPSLDLSSELTIAAWIRPERKATQYLAKKATQNGDDGYELSLSSGGKIFFRFNQNASGNDYRLDSRDSYPTDGNTWIHVAVTFDGSEMRLYLDGVENSMKSFTSAAAISLNSLGLSIAAENDGYRGFRGGMDELRIYKKALSPAEVNQLASLSSTPVMAEVPELSLPENGAVDVALASSLSWNTSAGAETYSVQISEVQTFENLQYEIQDLSTTSVYLDDLESDTEYFWRVRAENTVGNSEWSETWNFFTTSSETSHLIAHYKMEEGSGSTLEDASEYGNDANLMGSPVRISGMNGQAVSFNGSGQYALAADDPSLDLSWPLTLTAWIRPERKATQYLVKKASQNGQDGYELSLSSGGKVFFRFNQNTSGNGFRLDSKDSYPTDGSTWLHVAVTFDGSEMKLYLNGVENSSKTFTSAPSVTMNGLDLSIGAEADGHRAFTGAMDEVRLYQTALGAAEVNSLTAVPVSAEMAAFSETPGEEPETIGEFYAAPNPFSSGTRISFSFTEEEEFIISLFDMKGMMIKELKRGRAYAGDTFTVDLEGYSLGEGIYLVRLEKRNGNAKTIKLLKND